MRAHCETIMAKAQEGISVIGQKLTKIQTDRQKCVRWSGATRCPALRAARCGRRAALLCCVSRHAPWLALATTAAPRRCDLDIKAKTAQLARKSREPDPLSQLGTLALQVKQLLAALAQQVRANLLVGGQLRTKHRAADGAKRGCRYCRVALSIELAQTAHQVDLVRAHWQASRQLMYAELSSKELEGMATAASARARRQEQELRALKVEVDAAKRDFDRAKERHECVFPPRLFRVFHAANLSRRVRLRRLSRGLLARCPCGRRVKAQAEEGAGPRTPEMDALGDDMEALEEEADRMQAQADGIAFNDAGVIEVYNQRKAQIQRLEAEVRLRACVCQQQRTARSLAPLEQPLSTPWLCSRQVGGLSDEMATMRESLGAKKDRWLPALTELVETINRRFSQNFAEIGCAGEVHLKWPEGEGGQDEFEQYEIQIRRVPLRPSALPRLALLPWRTCMCGTCGAGCASPPCPLCRRRRVKFRNNEPLQPLTANRQSGGERSVSTILYLIALQVRALGTVLSLEGRTRNTRAPGLRRGRWRARFMTRHERARVSHVCRCAACRA